MPSLFARPVSGSLTLVAALLAAVLLVGSAAYRWWSPVHHETGLPGAGNPADGELALSVFDPPHPIAPIRFADATGRMHGLPEFRGRVVLLDIWATWCVPCRREMPALDRLAGRLAGTGFLVLPVSIDRDGSTVAPFYRALGIERLGVWLDPLGRGTSPLAVPGLPTAFLIDREGRMAARKMGAAQWDDPAMIALIRRWLPPASAAAGPRQ